MKEKIIEILNKYEGRLIGSGVFAIHHAKYKAIATDLEPLINQEVERRIKARYPDKYGIMTYFYNHFDCHTDVVVGDKPKTESAMTYEAVLKMFDEWLRSRLTKDGVNSSQKTEGGGE